MASGERGSIRPAVLADAAALAALLGELGHPTSADIVAARLARFAAGVILVADVDGEVAGLATGHLVHLIHVDRPVGVLGALVVGEAHRAHGVGRHLVAAVEDWARAEGAWRMTVASGLARSGAHVFYEKLGYEHTGRRYSRVL